MGTTSYSEIGAYLRAKARTWLITGVAGFIGSNILEELLKMGQSVVGLDNFSTGTKDNLREVQSLVSPESWSMFRFVEGDISDPASCMEATKGVEYVLHQAALGSVPRSIEDPLGSNNANVSGFLNMLVAARENSVKRFVYASSSSVYGDDPRLPKVEGVQGRLLSPYALTKYVNELYADLFARIYEMEVIGLRYFNVFGPRQDPDGAYAAVIPKWISAMLRAESVSIFGNGETSRDFCYIANVVQANILAAMTQNPAAVGEVYNIAFGSRTSLNELFQILREKLLPSCEYLKDLKPTYLDFRKGDVLHSLADIEKAKRLLGYNPTHTIERGLGEALEWYKQKLSP